MFLERVTFCPTLELLFPLVPLPGMLGPQGFTSLAHLHAPQHSNPYHDRSLPPYEVFLLALPAYHFSASAPCHHDTGELCSFITATFSTGIKAPGGQGPHFSGGVPQMFSCLKGLPQYTCPFQKSPLDPLLFASTQCPYPASQILSNLPPKYFPNLTSYAYMHPHWSYAGLAQQHLLTVLQ